MRKLITAAILCLVSTTAFAAEPELIWAGGSLKLSDNSNPCFVADSFVSLVQLDAMNLFTEPMLTLRGGKLGFDLGIGGRLPVMSGRMLAGYNVFFDYTANKGHERFGSGIELYHPNFSTHMNLYLPITSERDGQEALPGIDLTFGIPIPDASFISVWPGLYYYAGRDEEDMGGMSMTVQVKPIKLLTISVGGRNDTLQTGRDKSELFAKFEVVIPMRRLGKDLFEFEKGDYPLDIRSQMDHKIMREEFITYENKRN